MGRTKYRLYRENQEEPVPLRKVKIFDSQQMVQAEGLPEPMGIESQEKLEGKKPVGKSAKPRLLVEDKEGRRLLTLQPLSYHEETLDSETTPNPRERETLKTLSKLYRKGTQVYEHALKEKHVLHIQSTVNVRNALACDSWQKINEGLARLSRQETKAFKYFLSECWDGGGGYNEITRNALESLDENVLERLSDGVERKDSQETRHKGVRAERILSSKELRQNLHKIEYGRPHDRRDASRNLLDHYMLSMEVGEQPHKPVAEKLGESLNADKEAEVRKNAATILGVTKTSQGINMLSLALRHDMNREVREASARALGMIDYPQGVPALLEGLADKRKNVREASLEALSETRNPATILAIARKGLSHGKKEVRRKSGQIISALIHENTPDEGDALEKELIKKLREREEKGKDKELVESLKNTITRMQERS